MNSTITVKAYSPKGLVVKGLSDAEAETIKARLGNAIFQFSKGHGGHVFSRKHESRIREIVLAMQTPAPNAEFEATFTMPVSAFDKAHTAALAEDARRSRLAAALHGDNFEWLDKVPAVQALAPDTMPGPWTKNAAGELIG